MNTDCDKKRRKQNGNLLYVLKLVWESDRLLLIFTLFKNAVEQIFGVFFFVYLTKYIFECIEKNISYDKLFRFLVIACSLHVVIHFINGWYETYRKINTPEIYRTVFHKVMDITETMELKDFEDPGFYDMYARALDKCVDDAMNITIKTGVFIGNVVSTIMSLVIVVSVDPMLLFFMIIPIAASFYFGNKNSKCNYEREKAVTRDKRTAEYVKRVYYEKKYAAELRLYDIDSLFLKRQENAVENMEKLSLVYRMKSAIYSFCTYGSYSIVAGIGAYIYVAIVIKTGHATSIASYIAMISAMAFSTNQLKTAVENGIYMSNESMLFRNLRDFLNRPAAEHVERKDCGLIETIEFQDVSFTYPGADLPTIQNMNFVWKRGDRIALVGYNGAGKTTLVKLIMGLYPVTDGRILVNGIDMNEIDGTNYRKHLGTVFQDLQVFAMTLCENVLMESPTCEEDYAKAGKALSMAQFDVNHQGLTKGLDTIISREFDEEGFVCSGGQAQKIAIARVFAQNPEMVILDEPSSALDPLAEYNMYNNMMHLSDGKGVIFISHRLSSARMAHRIYMMKNGSILEAGTHEELMDKRGEYYNMFMLQAQNYQDSIPEEMLKGAQAFYG